MLRDMKGHRHEQKVRERVQEITEEYQAARKSEPEDVVVARIITLLAEAETGWEEDWR